MDECPFCEIVAGEQDAAMVQETDRTVAFLDRNPATRGHTLVVPKRHVTRLFVCDEETTVAIFRTARRVALAMYETLDPAGLSMFYTSGELVGHVSHAHVHLVPRYEDDDAHLALPRETLDDEEGSRLSERLRVALQSIDGDS